MPGNLVLTPVLTPNQQRDPVPDASAPGNGTRPQQIAGCTLLQSLLSELTPILCVAVHAGKRLMALTTGKLAYLLDLDTQSVRYRLARGEGAEGRGSTPPSSSGPVGSGAGAGRGNLLCCCFDAGATRLATCGDGKCITLWDVSKGTVLRILEGHLGTVYEARFSPSGPTLYSCSDDGRLLVWDCNSGKVLSSTLHHGAAIRACALITNPAADGEFPLTGDGDGGWKGWDVQTDRCVEEVEAHSEWRAKDGPSLQGWKDAKAHHSGGIVCMEVSPNHRFLATGAADNTCKLWDVHAYTRPPPIPLTAAYLPPIEMSRRLEGYINVLEEGLGGLPDGPGPRDPNVRELCLGELDVAHAGHSTLLHTLRHEAPVLCCAFSADSDILVTGALDSAVRLWSTRRGQLLFQVNLPSPPSHLSVVGTDIWCATATRLLQLRYERQPGEEGALESLQGEDADAWTNSRPFTRDPQGALVEVDEDGRTTAGGASLGGEGEAGTFSPASPGTGPDGKASPSAEDQQAATLLNPDLRKLLAQGLVEPDFLLHMLQEQGRGQMDTMNILYNMQDLQLDPMELLRMMANSAYDPKDICSVLSGVGDMAELRDLLRRGSSIDAYMKRQSFQPVDEGARRPSVSFALDPASGQDGGNAADLLEQFRRFQQAAADRRGGKRAGHVREDREEGEDSGRQAQLMSWMDAKFRGDGLGAETKPFALTEDGRSGNQQDGDEDQEEYGGLGTPHVTQARPIRFPKGKVLHFIPTKQIKLLRDVQANRAINPIFFRNLGIRDPKNLRDLRKASSTYADEVLPRHPPTLAQREPRRALPAQQPARYNEPIKFVTGTKYGIREAMKGKLVRPGVEVHGTVSNLMGSNLDNSEGAPARSLHIGLPHPERHGGALHGTLFAQTLIYQPTGRRPTRPRVNFVVGNTHPVRERHLFR